MLRYRGVGKHLGKVAQHNTVLGLRMLDVQHGRMYICVYGHRRRSQEGMDTIEDMESYFVHL